MATALVVVVRVLDTEVAALVSENVIVLRTAPTLALCMIKTAKRRGAKLR